LLQEYLDWHVRHFFCGNLYASRLSACTGRITDFSLTSN
jgi:hypothetical protein